MENLNLAGEHDIKATRGNYKVGMYMLLSIIMLIVLWSIISEARWLLFNGGTLAEFDMSMLFGVIASVAITVIAFFTLGQSLQSYSKECDVLGGYFHIEERQAVMIWALIIGMVLGMGFWDIVTEINLAIIYGIQNIWLINVVVFDFGPLGQMIFPVCALVIIGIVKMGAVAWLYMLASKNIKRGTICSLASLDKDAILG